jgi:hypothetical protein
VISYFATFLSHFVILSIIYDFYQSFYYSAQSFHDFISNFVIFVNYFVTMLNHFLNSLHILEIFSAIFVHAL